MSCIVVAKDVTNCVVDAPVGYSWYILQSCGHILHVVHLSEKILLLLDVACWLQFTQPWCTKCLALEIV